MERVILEIMVPQNDPQITQIIVNTMRVAVNFDDYCKCGKSCGDRRQFNILISFCSCAKNVEENEKEE